LFDARVRRVYPGAGGGDGLVFPQRQSNGILERERILGGQGCGEHQQK